VGISSGLFNHTLTLQTLTETDDGMGGITTAWADSGTFRARISSLSAQERLAQDKNTTFATHRIYCDNMTITTADRIKWGSYYFQITGIKNPSEMYHHLEIDVREID
jgi:SPP1 family predicted phage head-tail adaptor